MVEGLIFLAALILFIDYMNKFYVSKDVDDPNTKRFLKEIVKISEESKIQMPMKTVLSLIGIVAIGTMSYFGIQEKINQHSTRLDLMEADLLKKAEQTPKNLEMYMLIEHNAKLIEKHQKQLDENIHTKVLLKEAEKKILKLQEDVEKLIRKNGVK